MFARSLALVACITAFTPAADDITLKSVRFGKTIQGEKLSIDDLKGNVVFVELWGIN